MPSRTREVIHLFLSKPTVKIRQGTADDISSIMSVERECPSAAHWTERQYRELFTPTTAAVRKLALVAQDTAETGDEGATLGFLVARHVAPEWELENIVVAPTARRMGVGKRLLESLLTAAHETHSEVVFLEVRESNVPARGLYEKLGFREVGRRKSYYSSPLEDAVLYSLVLR